MAPAHCSYRLLPLALALGTLFLPPQATHAQRIETGAGDGGGYDAGLQGAGGVGGGGGGSGSGDPAYAGAGGAGGQVLDEAGHAGVDGRQHELGAQGQGGEGGGGGTPLGPGGALGGSGGGGGGGAGTATAPASGLPQDPGGRGGAGGGGMVLTGVSYTDHTADVMGSAGALGEDVSDGREDGGGGGGGAGIVLTARGAVFLMTNASVTGGAGAMPGDMVGIPSAVSGGGGGGGGVGIVLGDGGFVDVMGSSAEVVGGRGGHAHFWAGDGGAGLFLYNGGTATLYFGTNVRGGEGGDSSVGVAGRGGDGAAGVLSNGATIYADGTVAGGDGGQGSTPGKGGAGMEIYGGYVGNQGTIRGGDGGAGASPTTQAAGGSGIVVRASASPATIVSWGTISGGNGAPALDILEGADGTVVRLSGGALVGGSAGPGPTDLAAPAMRVAADDTRLLLGGNIQAGSGGAAAANAIEITGDRNTLQWGGIVSGNVVASGSGNVLQLPETGGLLDTGIVGPSAQVRGFSLIDVAAGGQWEIVGASSQAAPWRINTGAELIAWDDASLGDVSAGVTMDGGTFAVFNNPAYSSARSFTLEDGGATVELMAGGLGANATLSGVIAGSGALVKTGPGMLTLAGANTYAGGTRVEEGELRAASDGALGRGPVEVDGGTLAYVGSVVARQPIVVQSGALRLQDSASAGQSAIGLNGSAVATVQDRGTLGRAVVTLADSASLTLAGNSTGGSAHVLMSGPEASLDISGSLGSAGDGIVTLGALEGQGRVALGARTLEVGEAGVSTVYAGTISGTGSLSKTGAGTLALTGANTYAGTTTVAGGSLIVGDGSAGSRASLAGPVVVRSGALLGGTGSLGPTTIEPGGVHAPGHSAGTQRIAGDYANHGVLRIDAAPNGHDRIEVAGGVDVAGATLDLRLGPDDASQWETETGPYTLIDKQSAGAVTGRFADVRNPLLFLDASVDTAGGDGNDVTLALARNAVPMERPAPTGNQRAVAAAIDALPQSHEVWRSVVLSTDAGALRRGLQMLSGDVHASVASSLLAAAPMAPQTGLAHLRRNLSAPMRPGAPTAAAGASDLPGARAALPSLGDQPLWVQVTGGWQRMAEDGNAPGLTRHSTSLAVGGDHAVGGGWRLGAALGYTDARLRMDQRSASADAQSYTATLYGGKGFALGAGTLKLMAGASYSWHDIDSRRRVDYGSLAQTLTADYRAGTTQLFAEAGYALPMGPDAALEPFAGLAWSELRTRGFSESGGSAALSANSQSQDLSSSLIGLRARWRAPAPGRDLVLRGLLGWRHAYGSTRPQATLSFDQGAAFTVAGNPIARDAVRVEVGADLVVVRGVTAGLSYAGEFGGGVRQHTGALSVRWRF